LNGLLLALDGAPFWFLMAPVQAVHQPSDMSAVVANAELRFDERGDSRRGPQVGAVAERERSAKEQLHQAAPLGPSQTERTAWGEAHPQGLLSATPTGIAPAHDRTGVARDATPHFVERVPGVE